MCLKVHPFHHRLQTIAAEVLAVSTRAAFVSTPSLFFSLPEGAVKSGSKVLDVRRRKRVPICPLTCA